MQSRTLFADDNYEYYEMIYEKSCISNIIKIVISITILLGFYYIVGMFFTGTSASIMMVLPMDLCIWYLIKTTNIDKLIGNSAAHKIVLICSVIALFSIWLGATFIFREYLSGTSYLVSEHKEHALMFEQMQIIAERLKAGMSISEATKGLVLGQYYTIFVYCSLMFVMGGANPTNMAVWATMHLFISILCILLIANKFSNRTLFQNQQIVFIALFQPLFWYVFSFNKVVVGQAFVMLALYIYASVYDKPELNLLLLPIYGYLLYIVRLQYVLIAIVLSLVALAWRKDGISKRSFLILCVWILLGVFIAIKVDIIQLFAKQLNYDVYISSDSNLSITSFPIRIVRSLIVYFPLTNLFSDWNWTSNMFCVMQEVVNITLFLYLFGEIRREKTLGVLFRDPMVLAFFGFFASGLVSALHITYLSVGAPLLAIEMNDISIRKILRTFFVVLILLFVMSVIYIALGLRGSGFMYVVE